MPIKEGSRVVTWLMFNAEEMETNDMIEYSWVGGVVELCFMMLSVTRLSNSRTERYVFWRYSSSSRVSHQSFRGNEINVLPYPRSTKWHITLYDETKKVSLQIPNMTSRLTLTGKKAFLSKTHRLWPLSLWYTTAEEGRGVVTAGGLFGPSWLVLSGRCIETTLLWSESHTRLKTLLSHTTCVLSNDHRNVWLCTFKRDHLLLEVAVVWKYY